MTQMHVSLTTDRTGQETPQAFNPYLPFDRYIPDAEPHVFDGRVYVYGSHDQEGGDAFCMLDYEVWSASVRDLTDWRCEGTIYRAEQDPTYGVHDRYMYAPDVVRGNDGRYYLYYAMSGGDRFTGPIHVAVCDTPAGQYEYWGEVRWPDGRTFDDGITFDPGVINDDGTIRLYYGWSLGFDPAVHPEQAAHMASMSHDQLLGVEAMLFGKTPQQLATAPYDIMGANTVALADDMLTVVGEPKRIVPSQFEAEGTTFEGHAFFEASSIRKIDDTYYFIYSSQLSHELCYATSSRPDEGFRYGGTLVSNGDIGLHGRKAGDRLATTGNNHGSIVALNGRWYVFYHRQTHKTSFSRQGCAEPITIESDGSIAQVEMTSCGLNGGPLIAQGTYSAALCCNLTNGHMPHQETEPIGTALPHINHDGHDHIVSEVDDNTLMGFKYFVFDGATTLTLAVRGTGAGVFHIYADDDLLADIDLRPSVEWNDVSAAIAVQGTHALNIVYRGTGLLDIKELRFDS